MITYCLYIIYSLWKSVTLVQTLIPNGKHNTWKMVFLSLSCYTFLLLKLLKHFACIATTLLKARVDTFYSDGIELETWLHFSAIYMKFCLSIF